MPHGDYEVIDATDREEGESLRDIVREARAEREADDDDDSSLAEQREDLEEERASLEREAEETRVVRDDDTASLTEEREQLEQEREQLEEEAEETQVVRDSDRGGDDDAGMTAPLSEPTDDPSRDQPPAEMMDQMASDIDDDDAVDVQAAQDRAFIRRVEREDPLAARFTPPEEFPSEAAAPLATQFTPPSEIPREAFGPLPTRLTPPSELDESFPGFEPEFIQPREIEPRDEPDRLLLEFESTFREEITEPLEESFEEGLEEQERVGLTETTGFLGASPTGREVVRSTPDVIQGAVEAPRAIRELRFESQRRRREASLDALADPVETDADQAIDVVAPGERILAEGSIEAARGFQTFVREEGVERGAGRAAAFTVGAFGIGAGLTSGARSVSRAISRDLRGVDRATGQLPRTRGRRRGGRGDTGDRVEITAADIDPRMLSRGRGRTPAQVREARGRRRTRRERESFEQRQRGGEGGPGGRRESVEAPEVEVTQRQQLVAERQIETLRARGDPIPSRLQEFLDDPVSATTRPVTGPRTGLQTEGEAIGRVEQAEQIEVLQGPSQLEASGVGVAEPVDTTVETGMVTEQMTEQAQESTISQEVVQEPDVEIDPVTLMDEETGLGSRGDVTAETAVDVDADQRAIVTPRSDVAQREDLVPISIPETVPGRVIEGGRPVSTGRRPLGRFQQLPTFRNRPIPRIPPLDIELDNTFEDISDARRRRLFIREFESPVSPDPFEDIESAVGDVNGGIDLDMSGLD